MFAIAVGKQKYPGRHHKGRSMFGVQCLLMTIHFYAKQIKDQASLFWGNLIHEWAWFSSELRNELPYESPLTLLDRPRNHINVKSSKQKLVEILPVTFGRELTLRNTSKECESEWNSWELDVPDTSWWAHTEKDDPN